MSFWDRPDAQQALRDRAMDREWMRDVPFMQDDWEPQPADDNGHSTGARPDDPDVHETCGFVWSIHDTKRLPPNGVATPFGCPWSEQEAIERWGQR